MISNHIESFIQFKDVEYSYDSDSLAEKAIRNINIEIPKGQFVVVLGRNGSGKSTFAKLINGLLLPTKGSVYINGLETSNVENIWTIRANCGMIFQNPDNQMIGATVEEEVAFGLENLGVTSEEIRNRVDDSLKKMGLYELRKQSPLNLSGGQKQKVAIAGVLAMNSDCIILDEATSMLDPIGKGELLETLIELNDKQKITIIHITNIVDEISLAARVIVIDEGNILMDGKPHEVFSDVVKIKNLGLEAPPIAELFNELINEGYKLPKDILTVEEALGALQKYKCIE